MTHSLNAQLAAARIARMHREAEQQRRIQFARRSRSKARRADRFKRRP